MKHTDLSVFSSIHIAVSKKIRLRNDFLRLRKCNLFFFKILSVHMNMVNGAALVRMANAFHLGCVTVRAKIL